MNATATAIQFKDAHHQSLFEDMIGDTRSPRGLMTKREQAVIYLISAMTYPHRKELFHPLARFPELGKAVALYEAEKISERDATIFALAMNIHNGQDVLDDFRIFSKATPYHFIHKLKRDSFLMGEAIQISLDGY